MNRAGCNCLQRFSAPFRDSGPLSVEAEPEAKAVSTVMRDVSVPEIETEEVGVGGAIIWSPEANRFDRLPGGKAMVPPAIDCPPREAARQPDVRIGQARIQETSD